MNSMVITIIGLVLCTGPLWGAALGYTLAMRGYRLRSPLHHDETEGDL